MSSKKRDRPIGVFVPPGSDLEKEIQTAQENYCTFVVTSLYHPRSGSAEEDGPRCDLELRSTDWYRLVVLEMPVRPFKKNVFVEAEKMSQAFSYTLHLGISTTLWTLPSTKTGLIEFGRLIAGEIAKMTQHNVCQLWFQLPATTPNAPNENGAHQPLTKGHSSSVDMDGDEGINRSADDDWDGSPRKPSHFPTQRKSTQRTTTSYNEATEEYTDTWQQWRDFQDLLPPDRRIGLALDLRGDLPDDQQQKRWCGEMLRAVILHTRDFYINDAGYPVLPKPTQNFLQLLMSSTARKLNLLVKGNPWRSPKVTDLNIGHYVQYLDHLRKRCYDQERDEDAYARGGGGFENYLQIPLQPLKDHLESQTYEVFERDPVKYERYKQAIMKALEHKQKDYAIEPGWIPTILVCGAGRGPLVDQSIKACMELKFDMARIYVVEKNPHALVTLRYRFRHEWSLFSPRIYMEVIEADMRDYKCPQTADIVVSELLGSFGDNELSPECLDGLHRSCNEYTVSIPQAYRSYLQPIQSSRLHLETHALALAFADKHHRHAFENNYVVYIKQAFRAGAPQICFGFDHTQMALKPDQRDNRRKTTLEWTADIDYVLHGFAGYFDSQLYDDINITTVHGKLTQGMFSWFPIFFPIAEPIFIKSGQKVKATWWRFSNDRSVWYEWIIEEPVRSQVHNSQGRSLQIGL